MMRQFMLKYCFLVISLVAIVSCRNDDAEEEPVVPTARAILFFIGADNTLSRYARLDIEELINGASSIPRDGKVLVFVDDWNDNPRIYEISRTRKDTVRLYTYPDAVCCADPTAMREVLQRMCALAPSPEYGVVMWSHGCGWIPGVHTHNSGPQKSIIFDGHGSSAESRTCKMGVEELADALSVMPKLSFLFFDACMMQGIEVAYALRNVTDYIIASPAEIPGEGATYDHMMERFFQKDSAATAIARQYYDDEMYTMAHRNTGGVVISVVETCRLERFAQVTKKLMDGAEPQLNDAQDYWRFCGRTSDYPDFYDIKGVMRQYAGSEHYGEWCALRDSIIVTSHATESWDSVCDGFAPLYRGKIKDMSDVCGVSIYVPQAKYGSYGRTWDQDIKQTEWWQAVM